MKNPWFRLHAEFATDPKVQSMSETLQRRFIMLLCLQCNDELTKLDDSELCFALRIDETSLDETKQVFIKKGFIDENWQIINWDKRQYKSDNSTERSKRYREKKRKENQRNVSATLQQRDANAIAALPDTDTDTDTDTETEKNKKTLSSSVKNLFDFWKEQTGSTKSKLDDKRKAIIRNALKLYSEDEARQAITGCTLTPHNMGKNDRGEKYLGLHVIFKNADQIDRFINNFHNPPQMPKNKQQQADEAMNDFICDSYIDGSVVNG